MAQYPVPSYHTARILRPSLIGGLIPTAPAAPTGPNLLAILGCGRAFVFLVCLIYGVLYGG